MSGLGTACVQFSTSCCRFFRSKIDAAVTGSTSTSSRQETSFSSLRCWPELRRGQSSFGELEQWRRRVGTSAGLRAHHGEHPPCKQQHGRQVHHGEHPRGEPRRKLPRGNRHRRAPQGPASSSAPQGPDCALLDSVPPPPERREADGAVHAPLGPASSRVASPLAPRSAALVSSARTELSARPAAGEWRFRSASRSARVAPNTAWQWRCLHAPGARLALCSRRAARASV